MSIQQSLSHYIFYLEKEETKMFTRDLSTFFSFIENTEYEIKIETKIQVLKDT